MRGMEIRRKLKMAEETKVTTTEEEIEEQDAKTAEGSEGKEDGSKSDKKSEGKTFTQDQVTKMMTKEKNQGRNAAYKEMGIDPKDTKMVAMFRAFIESQKTEDQKAAEKESENQAKVNEAEQRAVAAEAKAEAMMLGVKPQYVDDVVTLALAKKSDDSDLKTIIGEFKTKYPVWFGESDDDKKEDEKSAKTKVGQKGTGSSVKSEKGKESQDNKGLGARLAAQRKSNNKKSSYWGK